MVCPHRCALPAQNVQHFQHFDDMLKLTISPQAKRAETDRRQGTPTRARLQPPENCQRRLGSPRRRTRRGAHSQPASGKRTQTCQSASSKRREATRERCNKYNAHLCVYTSAGR